MWAKIIFLASLIHLFKIVALSSVLIVVSVECGCACQLVAGDCSPLQDYRPDLCSCQCRDILGKQSCLDAGRIWDDSLCSCGCSQQQDCSTGLSFDSRTCSCIMLESNFEDDSKAAFSSDEAFPTLEHILIIILASIILVLLVILICLSVKIRSLSVRIQFHSSSSPNPLTDSDLEVKQLGPGNPVYGEGSCSTPSSGFYSEIAAGERIYKRESDSLYHSAESVRLKKRSSEESELKPPVNIIENALVGDDVFLHFGNMDSSSGSPDLSLESADLQHYDTVRRNQPRSPGPVHTGGPVHFTGHVHSPSPKFKTSKLAPDSPVQSGTLQYGTIKVRPADSDYRGYNSLSRPVDKTRHAARDTLRYESATQHIDEALRLLQESADNL